MMPVKSGAQPQVYIHQSSLLLILILPGIYLGKGDPKILKTMS